MAHMKAPFTATLGLLAAFFLPAAAEQPPAPQVAVPGTPGTAVSGSALAEQLKAALLKAADPALAEVDVTDQYAIHEVTRSKAGQAAIHPGWSEVHLILEGGATLVTGGTMINGPGGATIEGGVSHALKKGDVFIIPANTPHRYSQVDGSVTYFEVRFVTAPPRSAVH